MKITITLFFTLMSICAYSQLTLDTTFANDGFLDYNGMKSAKQLATDSSERIVCWAKTNSSQNAIVRFLPDGAIDNSFGTNGSVAIQYQSLSLNVSSILVLSTGDILFYGKTNGNFADLIVGKLKSNGAIDTTFGDNGYFSFPSTFQNVTPISLIEYNEKFLIASNLVDGNADTFNTVLVKINTDGSIDQTFADNGSKVTQIQYGIFCSALKSDDSGNIYISGDSGMLKYYISKYTPAGLLDSSFGTNGESVGLLPDHAISHSLQLTQDKIFVFGEYDGVQAQPLIHYYKTAAAKFDLATGNFMDIVDEYTGADRFDGGFASYRFEDGQFLFGGSLSFQESGGPQLTRFLKEDDDFNTSSYLTIESYPINILSYSKQGSAVLAAGNRGGHLFITRILEGPLGVQDFVDEANFTIYPNPSNSEFKIKIGEAIKTVEIYDELGKNLANYVQQDSYDISNFSKGIYFIHIETENAMSTKKLLIE